MKSLISVHGTSPVAMLGSLRVHRQLLRDLIYRDVRGRYQGSAFGMVWSLFTPLLMLGIYTFVFSVVFNARWGTADDDRLAFSINLYAGLIVHGIFAECLNRAPGLILDNINYVKKVVFPLEILPWVSMGTALFHASISMIILLGFFLVDNGYIHWTVVYVPVVLLPLILLVMGLVWLLASLGVFLRDIAQVTGLLTTVLMFMSPVFYPASALPETYRPWLQLNPLTYIIEQLRACVVRGLIPEAQGLGLYLLGSMVVMMMGFAWFQRTRKGFADVL